VQIHERDSQISADGSFAVGCECSLGTPLFRNVRSNSRATLQGTVKLLEWTNPHVWLWVDGSDAKVAQPPMASKQMRRQSCLGSLAGAKAS